MCFCEHIFSLLLDKYLKVGLVDYRVCVYFTFFSCFFGGVGGGRVIALLSTANIFNFLRNNQLVF